MTIRLSLHLTAYLILGFGIFLERIVKFKVYYGSNMSASPNFMEHMIYKGCEFLNTVTTYKLPKLNKQIGKPEI